MDGGIIIFVSILIIILLVQIVIIVMLLKAVNNRNELMESLDISEKKYRGIFESMQEGYALFQIIYDEYQKPIDYYFVDCNPTCESITRLDKNHFINKSITKILPQIAEDRIGLYNGVAVTGVAAKYEQYSKDLCKYLLVNVYKAEKDKLGFIITDITQNKLAQEEILYIGYHDKLTDLYNRRFFEEALIRLDTEQNLPLSIIMADVNGLKLVNDAFGHVAGDNLLIEVAKTLKKACREDEIIARLGGDEFIILLPRTSTQEVEEIICRIREIARQTQYENIELSIALGWDIKNNKDQDMQSVFKIAEDNMYKHKLFESASMRSKIIETIIRTLHEKEKREEQHSKRVSLLCERIAKALGLAQREVNELKTLGMMHDIGKIAINENILNKTGTLTEVEWNEVKRHSEIGYNILRSSNDTVELAEYILYHHENWDGMGYPKGIKAQEIPIQARIIKIADAYDAMTSDRPYRKAMKKEEVVKELSKNAGTQFDPDIVSVFIEKVLSEI